MPKLCHKFYCEHCDYGTSKKSSFENHCESKRHKMTEKSTVVNEIMPKLCSKIYTCECCQKIFKDRSGLWRHKKKCMEFEVSENMSKENELMMMLIKENSEFKNIIVKLLETGTTNNTTHHHTTNNIDNNTFNLNFFLNETCKDAMNISDFVSSIKVNLTDLEHTGKQGYIEGISNIIVKNLNNIEQHFRPIHCSDSKREVFYIKNNNEWQKEQDEKPILTNAIKFIANENIKQIKHWREKYPDCINAESKKNNFYLKIVSNSMNGITEEEGTKNIHKIISNVAKEVTIDKHN